MSSNADILAPLYQEVKEIFYAEPAYLNHAELIIPYIADNDIDMNEWGNLEALIEACYELGLEDGASRR